MRKELFDYRQVIPHHKACADMTRKINAFTPNPMLSLTPEPKMQRPFHPCHPKPLPYPHTLSSTPLRRSQRKIPFLKRLPKRLRIPPFLLDTLPDILPDQPLLQPQQLS